MIVPPPVCLKCRHFRPDVGRACAAFPADIPDVVWLWGDPHTGPIPGDHGIRFEPITTSVRQPDPVPPDAVF